MNISTDKKMYRLLSIFLIGTLVSFFLIYSFQFTVNFPFQDDLLLVNFVNEVVNGVDLETFLGLLFRTDNDHKVVIPRLIALVNYLITGSLNFKFYIALVWGNLLFILYFLYSEFRKTDLPILYFLPVPLLFLHPQYYEVSQWAINGMQHSFLTVFLISALFLISKPSHWAYTGAIVLCFLATFTHGNGILSFPAIVFYFVCVKEFKKAGGVVLCMLVALGIYLYGYEKGQAVAAPTEISVVVTNFLGFVGALMSQWNNNLLWPVMWGILILGYSAYLVWRLISNSPEFSERVRLKENVKLLTVIGFITLTSFVIAVFRSSQGSTLVSRFEIYTALGSSVFYLLLISNTEFFRKKYVLWVVILFSGIINLHSYYRYTGIVADRRTVYQADIFNWRANNTLLSVDKSLQRNASFYLYPAYERDILQFPEPVVSVEELSSFWDAKSSTRNDESVYLEKIVSDSPVMVTDSLDFLVNETFHELTSPLNQRFLILLHKDSNTFYMMEASPPIEGRRSVFFQGRYYKKGFKSYIRTNNLPSGTYNIGLLDVEKNGIKELAVLTTQLTLTSKKLQFQGKSISLVVVR